MSATVNVNGRITDDRDAVISVFDHGFLYGEGIYETMRTYHRRAFLYDRHMRRLRRSAKMIDLPLPFTDDQLAAQIRDTQAIAKIDGEVYIRVLVTRGIGDLTVRPEGHAQPLDRHHRQAARRSAARRLRRRASASSSSTSCAITPTRSTR